MRLIDADALVAQIEKECCINCAHRKSSSGRFIYDIGGAPCKACGVYDAVDWIETANEIDAVQVVRCKDCKYWDAGNTEFCLNGRYGGCETAQDWYCLDGERKDDERA